MSFRHKKAVVVGAGPVGCLSAIALAKAGWQVDLFEARADLRLPSSKALSQQRSINLAISSRGIAALRSVDPGTADRFLKTAIPMRGRMIHTTDGKLDSQLYDMDGQCINSIDRALLNESLLDEASRYRTLNVFFKHKVQAIHFDDKFMVVTDIENAKDHNVNFDLCIGADGSYSVVRRQMMRAVRMDFMQEYITHEYIELRIAPGRDEHGTSVFPLDPNHLHIWPRHTFMLIALPNKDKSFTCTLFAPTADFDQLDTAESFSAWFSQQFPDAFSLIGKDTLMKDFCRSPRSPLICTKSKPYHYKDRGILLGDSAHSMVPFYGQGLNCGLEDVRILNVLLRQEHVEPITTSVQYSKNALDSRLSRALENYSMSRHEDLVAICELAMDNYVEMRHSVTTPAYIFRKALDNLLYSLIARTGRNIHAYSPSLSNVPFSTTRPKGWLPMYTMITFRPDVSYASARRKFRKQNKILGYIWWAIMAILTLVMMLSMMFTLR